MAYQRGFSADIEFYPESSYGGGLYDPASADTMNRISDAVTSITLTDNNNAEVIFSIGDVAGAATLSKQKEYTLRVEYILQDTSDNLLKYGINRNSDNDLDSLVFLIQYDNQWYECKGGICNTVEVTADVGEALKITQEFYCNEVSVSSTDPLSSLSNLSHSSALGTTFAKYSGATIKRAGSTIGYGTRSFSLTVNNNAERVHAVGADTANAITAGKIDISGTIDVYIEQGAATEWGWVDNATAASINIDTGLTNVGTIYLTNATFTTIDLPMNNTDAIVVVGMPFIAEDIAIT